MKTRNIIIYLVLIFTFYPSCSSLSQSSKVYNILDIGPAGGYIFYDKGSYSDGWRYLEAAPANSEVKAEWGIRGEGTNIPNTNTGIGSGHANTMLILEKMIENNESVCAAKICADMNINGYTDWFLPSRDELNEMYKVLCAGNVNANIGGFDIGRTFYWSSSEGDVVTVWVQSFADGSQHGRTFRYGDYCIRAIRAF